MSDGLLPLSPSNHSRVGKRDRGSCDGTRRSRVCLLVIGEVALDEQVTARCVAQPLYRRSARGYFGIPRKSPCTNKQIESTDSEERGEALEAIAKKLNDLSYSSEWAYPPDDDLRTGSEEFVEGYRLG